jgi:hypothetical protein
MAKGCECSGFLERGESPGVVGSQKLYRYIALEHAIMGTKYLTHAARPDVLAELVSADKNPRLVLHKDVEQRTNVATQTRLN